MDNDIKRVINGNSHASTLNKKPPMISPRNIAKPIRRVVQPARNLVRNIDIPRSKAITKFAQNISPIRPQAPIRSDIKPPQRHPMAIKADSVISSVKNIPQKAPEKPAKVIKEEAIAAAMAKPIKKERKKEKGFFKRHLKLNVALIILVVIIVSVYLVYALVPSFSVKIASMRAGISASYPEWHPDGYSLNGPITFGDDEVTIKFKANTGKTSFTIKQSKSSWDSTAVKENVEKISMGKLMTTEERGLTIYSYSGNAQWVNGGILYAITGDAPLSTDQIRRIANSF